MSSAVVRRRAAVALPLVRIVGQELNTKARRISRFSCGSANPVQAHDERHLSFREHMAAYAGASAENRRSPSMAALKEH
jgi:hypothetical protein